MSELLLSAGTIKLPETADLHARDAFTPGTGDLVGIGSVQAEFAQWFFPKKEAAGSPAPLECLELQRNAANAAILEALGSEVETTLAAVFCLLRQQNAGQPGALAVNGFGNVFYVRDAEGILRAVNVHWCAGAWSIGAMRVDAATEWPVRDRVFRTSAPPAL